MRELDWNEVAARLKELRKKNKLTIERLAEMVKVSTSFIGLIEKGESGISIENLYKLAQVFNCSLDYLITGTDMVTDSHARFEKLNAALYDYSDRELEFVIEMSNFLRGRVEVR